jgi:Tol biopolymer transport system component
VPATAVVRPRGWRTAVGLAVVVLSVLAAAASWLTRDRAASPGENPLANARITHYTNWEGAEEGAEISPDGKWVAVLADSAGEFDLWLSQVATREIQNLTKDFPPLAPSGFIVRKLGFSGNGAGIWFNPADSKPLLLMPLTGGTPRPFLPEGANTPAWNPDGTRLVYFFKPTAGDPMFVADQNGANARQLMAPDEAGMLHNNNPVWSPDGEWIYFVRGVEPQDEMNMDVWRLRASGGSPERLTEQHAAANFLAPLNARTLLYVARDEDWSGPWLWALDVERKVSYRIPTGADQYMSVAASRDGRHVVATVANPSANLWRVPLLLDRIAEEREAQPYPLPVPTGRALAPRFGGPSLFYLSARGTGDGLWKVQDGLMSEVWRGVDGALFEPPAVSPDGRRVAVVVRQAGKRHLAMMSADGTSSQAFAASIDIEGAAGQGAADWSPDGKWIVTGGRDAKGPALFMIPVDGGAPVRRLVEGKWVNPVWSPDGNLIVYGGRSIVGQVELHGVRPDGTAIDLPQVQMRPGGYRFLPSGTGLVYLPRIQGMDFWLLDFATRKTRPLARLANQGALRTFDITPDGKYIVFDRSKQNSNVVLIDLPQ